MVAGIALRFVYRVRGIQLSLDTHMNVATINDVENIDVTFASPVYSMGFDFAEPGLIENSTFEVTLKSGGTPVDTFQFDAPDDVISFIGVWSDTAFDRAEIREIIGGIDDEYFGEFYTGTTPLSATAGGSVTGLDALGVRCRNLTTRQSVVILLEGATYWNCEAAGLVVNPGDLIMMTVLGTAE